MLRSLVFSQLMKEGTEAAPPATQRMERMERKETLAEEHKAALVRAVTLKIPHAVAPPEGPSGAAEETAASDAAGPRPTGKPNWEQLVQKLFDKGPSGALILKKDIGTSS